MLKPLNEGYTGVLMTMSNDSMAGSGASIGEIVAQNERDTREVGQRLGLNDAFFLNYPNHNMDGWPILEMRARLVFPFRLLQIDTVLVYDPSALYETQSRSLHNGAGRRIGLLDGGIGMGLSRALQGWT